MRPLWRHKDNEIAIFYQKNFQFFIKKISNFFSAVIISQFLVIKTLDSERDPDPYPEPHNINADLQPWRAQMLMFQIAINTLFEYLYAKVLASRRGGLDSIPGRGVTVSGTSSLGWRLPWSSVSP
jgi:hypothetical protein